MGLFDSFTGARQRRDIGHGNEVYNAQIRKALNAGRGYLREGRDNALAAYSPYSQGGEAGFNLYADAVGARGADARQAAFENFEGDPFRDYANTNTENALRDVFRRYNAGGMADSGANRLATGRVAGEFARQDIANYLNRLQGLGNTGLAAAGGEAGVHQSSGAQLADLETSARSALGNQGINYGNALAGSRTIGINNLMNLANTAANAYAAYAGIPKKVG